MPVGQKKPRQTSFEEHQRLASSILSKWYKGEKPSFTKQIEDKHKSIKLSGLDVRKKALALFRLK